MIKNGSFEVADSSVVYPGLAADWIETTLGTGEDAAEFSGDSALPFSAVEGFEHGWSFMNPQSLINRLTTVPDVVVRENYELWLPNLNYIGIEPAESATFSAGASATETFANWSVLSDGVAVGGGFVESFSWAAVDTLASTTRAGFGDDYEERFTLIANGDPTIVWVQELG